MPTKDFNCVSSPTSEQYRNEISVSNEEMLDDYAYGDSLSHSVTSSVCKFYCDR